MVRYIQAEEPNTNELRTAFKGMRSSHMIYTLRLMLLLAEFDSVAPLFTVLFFIVRSAIRSRSKNEQVAEEVHLILNAVCADPRVQIKLLKLPPSLEADLQKAVQTWCVPRASLSPMSVSNECVVLQPIGGACGEDARYSYPLPLHAIGPCPASVSIGY